MDSVTHLIAGATVPVVFRNTPRRAAVLGFGLAVGQLPDIDVVFGFAPEALLVLHRGITHALIMQPVLALLAVVPFFLWMRWRKVPASAVQGADAFTPGLPPSSGRLGFGTLFGMALLGVYVQIYLDVMTTFGTKIFLPFSSYRAALPSMFIVDLALSLPALALLIFAWSRPAGAAPLLRDSDGAASRDFAVATFSAKARRAAMFGLAWILLYPLAALGVNAIAAKALSRDLAPQEKLTLLTEPFSPIIWKAVVDEGKAYRMSTVNLFALDSQRQEERWNKADPDLYAALKRQHVLFAQFEEFCSYMVQVERETGAAASDNGGRPVKEYAFMDVRYLISPESVAHAVKRTDPNFVLEARVDENGVLRAYRFLHRGNDTDTAWTELPEQVQRL